MKAILEFDLEDQSDKDNHARCLKSADLEFAVSEMLSDLRSIIKYDSRPDLDLKTVEEIRAMFYKRLEDRELSSIF
jgi:hypothetical protein